MELWCEDRVRVFGQEWATSVQRIVQRKFVALDFFVEIRFEHRFEPRSVYSDSSYIGRLLKQGVHLFDGTDCVCWNGFNIELLRCGDVRVSQQRLRCELRVD